MKNLLTRAGALLCVLLATPTFAATIPFANGTPYTTGTLTAANGAGSESNYVIPIPGKGFNVLLTGTAVASVVLERSFDDGATWVGKYAAGTQLYTWPSYSGTPVSESVSEPEFNVYYRLRVVSLTSGTITYRISQR